MIHYDICHIAEIHYDIFYIAEMHYNICHIPKIHYDICHIPEIHYSISQIPEDIMWHNHCLDFGFICMVLTPFYCILLIADILVLLLMHNISNKDAAIYLHAVPIISHTVSIYSRLSLSRIQRDSLNTSRYPYLDISELRE